MRARLVAVIADKKTATQRRRSRNAKSKGRASSQALVRDGWHILLTNVSSDVTAKELFEIYALRWNIETRFKAWKQSLNLAKVFKGVSNEDHYESLILVAPTVNRIQSSSSSQPVKSKRSYALT
jgi:IS4 transposase